MVNKFVDPKDVVVEVIHKTNWLKRFFRRVLYFSYVDVVVIRDGYLVIENFVTGDKLMTGDVYIVNTGKATGYATTPVTVTNGDGGYNA